MRLKNLIIPAVIVVLFIFSQNVFSQDGLKSRISTDTPVSGEKEPELIYDNNEKELNDLEKIYRKYSEDGNVSEAEKIKNKMYELIPDDQITAFQNKTEGIVIMKNPLIPEADWTTTNEMVQYGNVVNVPDCYRQIDVKSGEDGNLYSAVLRPNGNLTTIAIYKSTNQGLYWSHVMGIGLAGYMTNVSITVESKNNNISDSTRVIAFFTLSDYLYKNSVLYYLSVKSNGTEYHTGIVAQPDMGNKFTGISAVSDGAYYQSGTYFGVVCTESNNETGITQKTKFIRSMDWGSTWLSSALTTSYNDRFPSAAFKKGTSDSIYIAVERNFDATLSLIRVLAVKWIPSPNFKTYYVTPGVNTRYEKPCLNIRQTNPASQILITSTKNNYAVYHFSSDGGASWLIDYTLSFVNSPNIIYTYCSSSINGSVPFTGCVITSGGDSVNVRRGTLGSMGTTVYKVNSIKSKTNVSPVCEMINKNNWNFPIVLYAGTSTPYGNVYSTQEGIKKINLYLIPQGFYNPSTNNLSMNDTVRVYLRNTNSPYNTVDSAVTLLYSASLSCSSVFSNTADGNYYLSVKHRNSIETWYSTTVDFYSPGDRTIEMINSQTRAYGNNLIQVDDYPTNRFGIYSGDVNQDGTIDLADGSIIDNDAFNFTSGYIPSDVNGDGIVDVADAVFADNNGFNFVSKITP